jgi:hypothetical protein
MSDYNEFMLYNTEAPAFVNRKISNEITNSLKSKVKYKTTKYELPPTLIPKDQ